MGSVRGNLYESLFAAFIRAYPFRKKQLLQEQCVEFWNQTKGQQSTSDAVFMTTVQSKIDDLLQLATKRSVGSLNTFVKFSSAAQSHSQPVSVNSKHNNVVSSQCVGVSSGSATTSQVTSGSPVSSTVDHKKPSQLKSHQKINFLESKIAVLSGEVDNSFHADVTSVHELKKLRTELRAEKQTLKRKISNADRSKKQRQTKKVKLNEICQSHPEIAEKIQNKQVRGRPRLEEEQPELLKAICQIAMFGGSAELKRRSDEVRSCKTLDELLAELHKLGFNLSRCGLYLRFLPCRFTSIEGKKHVVTVPVRLCRAQANEHKKHPDTGFCFAIIKDLECVASVLGPREVAFMSQDDKSRVPIGITAAAKCQAPMLMHLEYKVMLPDHDWVVAERHKLIPSVYAGIVIKPEGQGDTHAVTYSGPTFIAIRSGKHSSSSAETHASDFRSLVENPLFDSILKTEDGAVKPVIILTVDGGPDENPRYRRVINCAMQHFKEYDLDAIFIATNAPGRSAFNRVERRMAPLSRVLSGVILPHEHFGSHLDERGRTKDKMKELQNFEYAGSVLAEIWSELSIDGHNVEAKYIKPSQLPDGEPSYDISSDWYMNHVRESQYLLQIVKCKSESCCGIRRSSLGSVLPNGFLPPPYLVQQTTQGLDVQQEETERFSPLLLRLAIDVHPSNRQFKQIPFDLNCTSVRTQLANRICKTCGLYFSSQKSATAHQSLHKTTKTQAVLPKLRPSRIVARRAKELLALHYDPVTGTENAAWVEEDDVEHAGTVPLLDEIQAEGVDVPIIEDVNKWLQGPWEDLDTR